IPEGPVEAWPWMFRIYTLGPFRIERHGEALGGSGKAQRRALQLLKLLIAHGGEKVSESRIVDALWPRIDGDSAHRSFTSTLHRLRKLLGGDRTVVLPEGKPTLARPPTGIPPPAPLRARCPGCASCSARTAPSCCTRASSRSTAATSGSMPG